jgi:hypothetical protein
MRVFNISNIIQFPFLFLNILMNELFSFVFCILTPITLYCAQRLAAQPPGHFRIAVTILAGFPQSHFSVRSLSLGQVGCSRVLGGMILFQNNY